MDHPVHGKYKMHGHTTHKIKPICTVKKPRLNFFKSNFSGRMMWRALFVSRLLLSREKDSRETNNVSNIMETLFVSRLSADTYLWGVKRVEIIRIP